MIRKNLEENVAARAGRAKRRRKVLVDQMKAHEAQEVIFLLARKVNLILGFQIFKILNKIVFLTNTTWWKFCNMETFETLITTAVQFNGISFKFFKS